jgi:hypothetical protein
MKKVIFFTLVTLFVLFSGCSSKNAEEVPVVEPVAYFDLTASELKNALSSTLEVDLIPMAVVDSSTPGEEIETFVTAGGSTNPTMHYHLEYNKETEKLSYISFSFDKNSVSDNWEALEHYYYHIGTIALTINIDTDAAKLFEGIKKTDGTNTGIDGHSLYETEDFFLSTSCDTFFNASFWAENPSK